MPIVYDFLATIGLIVCFAIAVLLLIALAAHIWAGVHRLRQARARRRYPTSAIVDLEAQRAATMAGYFSVRDHLLNVNRLREVDHDRAA